MGATCDKEFENIPDTTDFENHEYLKERERIFNTSIKQHHKTVKPNTSNISIGMIETKINTRVPHSNLIARQSGRVNASNVGFAGVETIGEEVDKEQLHVTKRPFQNSESFEIPVYTAYQPIHIPKQISELSFQFYHSIALPEYSFHPIPPEYMGEYQNLLTCEQEERNGIKYIGEWKDNKTIQGNGIMQSNTSKYIGQFMNGLKHFHGREIETREVYEGQFEFGRRKGEGMLYTPEYESKGYFDQNLRKGKINYNNGDIYEGELLNELYHGQGSFYNSTTKTKTSGTYKHGKLTGLGQITNQTMTIYEGEFVEGLKQGKGTYHYNNNEYYCGQFFKNQKHGKGELVTDFNKYEGNFVNGKMEGNILVTNNNGNRNYVIYKNGLPIDEEYSEFNPNIAEDGLTKEWRDKLEMKTVEQDTSDRELYNSSSFKLYGNYGLLYGPHSNKSSIPVKEENTFMQKPFSLQKEMDAEGDREILSEVSEEVIYEPLPIVEPPSPPSVIFEPPKVPSVVLPPASQLHSVSQLPTSQIRTPPPATISSNLGDNRLYRPENNNFENQLDNSIESTDINPKINETFIPYQNYNPYTSNIHNSKLIEEREIGLPVYNSKYDGDIIYNRIPNESKVRSELNKEGSHISGEVYNTPISNSKLKLESRVNEINFD